MQPSLVPDAVFDPECYHRFYGPGMTDQRSGAETAFVGERIGPPPRRVLDLACGHGRHAVRLAALGYEVDGLDVQAGFLAEASADAVARGVAVRFAARDMRELDAEASYEAVICLFTAFGYFEDDENEAVARAVARALTPDGVFLVDVVNRDRILRELRTQSFVERDDDLMIDRTRYDERSGRIVTHRTYRVGARRVETTFATRQYTLPELTGLLARAGLAVDGAWGAFDGRPYALDAPRLIVRARRSGATS